MSYQDGYEMGRRDAYHGSPPRYPQGASHGPFYAGYLDGYNS